MYPRSRLEYSGRGGLPGEVRPLGGLAKEQGSWGDGFLQVTHTLTLVQHVRGSQEACL